MIIELGLLLWFGARYMKRQIEELNVVEEKIHIERTLPVLTTINNYFAVKIEKVDLRITRDMTDRCVEPPDYY